MKGRLLIGLIFLMASCLSDDYVTTQEQLNKEIKAIDKYLADHGISALKDASGIRIQVIQVGTGLPPNLDNKIEVDYVGKLLSNGQVFDDGTTQAGAILRDFIPGWRIGLGMLPEGSIAKVYIPSYYAYGPSGYSSIPGNATLVFDVELVDVTPTTTQNNRLAQDIVAIDEYLAENEVQNVIEHESGIRYVVENEGDGAAPTSIYNQIKLDYKGSLLSDGTIFLERILEPNSDFSSRIANFPIGLFIGLQLLQEGDKVTFYVPSTLAFGADIVRDNSTGAVIIPANSNIIFEVELLDVLP